MIAFRDIHDDEGALGSRLGALLDAHSEAEGHPFTGETYGLEAWKGDVFCGGAQYYINHGWCFLKLFAITDGQRGTGLGTRLIEALETRIRSRGGIGIWLDTFGYQAAPFYRRRGFEEFARLPGPEPARDRIFMRKSWEHST